MLWTIRPWYINGMKLSTMVNGWALTDKILVLNNVRAKRTNRVLNMGVSVTADGLTFPIHQFLHAKVSAVMVLLATVQPMSIGLMNIAMSNQTFGIHNPASGNPKNSCYVIINLNKIQMVKKFKENLVNGLLLQILIKLNKKPLMKRLF